MRWGELILTEDDYASLMVASSHVGARGRALEWCLMYSKGVPVVVIARWCRVDPRRVRRAVQRRTMEDLGWWGRCQVVHDQPAPALVSSAAGARPRVDRERVWWDHYTAYAAYMAEHGRAPSQLGGSQECRLYKWVQAQRGAYQGGRLTVERAEALGRVGDWAGVPRGNLADLWETRLQQVEAFRKVEGRFPIYHPQDRPEEKVLAIWLGRQRTWFRKNTLTPARRDRLDTVLNGWTTRQQTRSYQLL